MRFAAQNQAGKALAAVRIAVAIFFLFFGEYKIVDPMFANGAMAQWLQGFIDHDAVHLYGVLLQRVALPHAVLLGYAVGAFEMTLGVALLLGIFVRPAAIVGMAYMGNLVLATWFTPGHGAPAWRYFGNELDHIPLLLLFVVFYATNAGDIWGLDGYLKRRNNPPRRFMRAA
ncbi:MAG: DoxX family protein [Acidobacteria bacterium]|nr:DoxX family protein [Acidobacteriota bacterium]